MLVQPQAAGIEHFQAVYERLDTIAPESEKRRGGTGPSKKLPYLGGAPVTLRLNMVRKLGEFTDVENNFIAISEESAEEEVAAVLLFLRSVGDWLSDQLVEWGWLDVPCQRWIDVFKTSVDRWRRYGMIGSVKDERVWDARNILRLCERTGDEADWATEMMHRQRVAVIKVAPGYDRPTDAFMRLYEAEADRICRLVVMKVSNARRQVGIDEWWQARGNWVPSGSSDQRKMATDAIDDERLRSVDRVNKKGVFETVDMSWLQEVFMREPFNYARASTKPEPGRKQRALYASEDGLYMVASYASGDVEKVLHFDGMQGKQRPTDVVEWWKMHRSRHGYWLSADFTDFNAEETHLELKMLNMRMAKAWLDYGDARVAVAKAAAAVHVGTAFDMSVVKLPGGELKRVVTGLYSGSRDTARDNTINHRIYTTIALACSTKLGYRTDIIDPNICGDDEDCLHAKLSGAIVYVNMLSCCGHMLKPQKQLGGKAHEFLRMILCSAAPPERPLASIASTLATGNWYVPKALWYNSVIESCASNWWDCVCRGMPLHTAQLMCYMYLQVLMRYKDDDGNWVELDWWPYAASAAAPLWQYSNAGDERPPKIQTDVEPLATWPSKATDDWMEQVKPILKQVNSRRRQQYRMALLQRSWESSFGAERQKLMLRQCKRTWPLRDVNRKIVFCEKGQLPERMGHSELFDAVSGIQLDDAPRSQEEQLARMGIDLTLYKLVGGSKELMAWVGAEGWSRYATVNEGHKLLDRAQCFNAAFRYYLSRVKGPFNGFHGDAIGEKKTSVLLYTAAPNAAGKSTYVRQSNYAVELDELVYQTEGWRKKWDMDVNDPWRSDVHALVLALRRASDRGAREVCGQWPIKTMIKAGRLANIKVKVRIVEPDMAVLMDRWNNRGWDEKKKNERLKRWYNALQGYEKVPRQCAF